MKDTKSESQGNMGELRRIIEDRDKLIVLKDKLIDTQTEHLQAVREQVMEQQSEVKRNRDLVEEYKDKYWKLQKGVKWMISQSKDVQELAEEEVA